MKKIISRLKFIGKSLHIAGHHLVMIEGVVFVQMVEHTIETVVTEVYKLKGLEKSNKTLCISLLVEKNILNGKFYNNSK